MPNQSAPRDDVQKPYCVLDHEDDFDWDEVVARILEDDESAPLAFNSADYATEEAAMKAHHDFIHAIFVRAERRAASEAPLDTSR